jgi:hypothetical protein
MRPPPFQRVSVSGGLIMIGDLLRPLSVDVVNACILATPTTIQASKGTGDENAASGAAGRAMADERTRPGVSG